MGWHYGVTGEAVVVEVAPGSYLFALLEGAGTTEYMGFVAPASIAGREGRVIDPSCSTNSATNATARRG